MAGVSLYPNDSPTGGETIAPLEPRANDKIDWLQLAMFILALLSFTGAAILWLHSGPTP
jgi:hypothetical protein